ncbi:hypothetical protein ACLKA7_008959 [Drosophila subpalustris]
MIMTLAETDNIGNKRQCDCNQRRCISITSHHYEYHEEMKELQELRDLGVLGETGEASAAWLPLCLLRFTRFNDLLAALPHSLVERILARLNVCNS